jgi:ABC-type glycerol-3-phosphate transport system permease component
MASRNSYSERDYLQPSHWRRNIWNLIFYLMLILGSLMFILPLFWALSSSFKSDYQVMQYPPQWIPSPLRWQNYPEALTYVPFGRFALNTLFIAALAILGNLLSCTIIAYGFARLRAPGKNFFFILMLSTMMLVEPVRIIPLYIEFNKLGWIDSYLPLIVPAFFGSPFYIFLLRQFFMNIPLELEEAALIDGANRLQILWKVIVPLSKPALAAIAIFNFQGVWNDFLYPLVFLHKQSNYTIALGLNFFRSTYTVHWGYLMAASIVALLPMVIIFFIAQRYFIQGITFTGIKG